MRIVPLALWHRLAGLGYGLGEWALSHDAAMQPTPAARTRMRACLDERLARGFRHGLAVKELTDEDVESGAAAVLAHYVDVNIAHGGMHGMADVPFAEVEDE